MKLEVKCAVCDMTSLTDEYCENYETIAVKAATVLITPAAKAVAARHGVSIKAATVIDVPTDAVVTNVNGKLKLGPTTEMKPNTALNVNGALILLPDSGKAMDNIVHAMVNGVVIAPESASGCLSKMSINGSTYFYPDGATLIEGAINVDRVFVSRARKDAVYYALDGVYMVDASADINALVEKNVSFATEENVLVAESLLDAGIGLFDEKCKLKVVPDGTAVVKGDAKLNDALLMRYGSRLYINGDLEVRSDAKYAVEKLETVYVCGDVRVAKALAGEFLHKCREYNELEITDETAALTNSARMRVSADMLKRVESVSIVNHGDMSFDTDIEPEFLSLKIKELTNNGLLRMSLEQQAALLTVTKNNGVIMPTNTTEEAPPEDDDTVRIKAATYKM